MSFTQSENGVILQKLAYSDADEIITVLFERSGVKKLFVKGSRSSKKRFAGRIDHFQELAFQYQNKTQGLSVLQAIDELPGRFRLEAKADLLPYAYLNYFAEFVREFFWENGHADEVYKLWQDLTAEIHAQSFTPARAFFYTLALIRLAGYEGGSVDQLADALQFPQKILEKPLRTLGFLQAVLA